MLIDRCGGLIKVSGGELMVECERMVCKESEGMYGRLSSGLCKM